ncbi:choice-of-anchor E domain-containing protein [Alteromonas portus]|uniref:Choice-of-anchor E domain-containing protein n=1 Tax=Alteromonas portus TaxID=2565549 RepID=A0A4U0ZNV8_9ALTE|nr:choice-of-anchor E domain-containing protein [Alteromonas portus]TKB03900.1 choice-of-anchor E domain-containing protein [Alteromonas portus]
MFKRFFCVAVLSVLPVFAHSAVIVQDLSVTRQATDFDTPITFNLFDNTLTGDTLQSVIIELFARSSGSVKIENRNPSRSANVTARLSTSITLYLMDGLTSISASPFVFRSDVLSAFDGSLDYDGSSGVEFLNLATNDYEVATITSDDLLTLFTGVGQGQLLFEAIATSGVTGGGNLSTIIDTFASADVRITYFTVSESGSFGILLLGIGMLVARRKLN